MAIPTWKNVPASSGSGMSAVAQIMSEGSRNLTKGIEGLGQLATDIDNRDIKADTDAAIAELRDTVKSSDDADSVDFNALREKYSRVDLDKVYKENANLKSTFQQDEKYDLAMEKNTLAIDQMKQQMKQSEISSADAHMNSVLNRKTNELEYNNAVIQQKKNAKETALVEAQNNLIVSMQEDKANGVSEADIRAKYENNPWVKLNHDKFYTMTNNLFANKLGTIEQQETAAAGTALINKELSATEALINQNITDADNVIEDNKIC